MDFDDILQNWTIILPVILIIVFQFFARKKGPKTSNTHDIARQLLRELGLNRKLAEIFTYHHRSKKFISSTWKMVSTKVDFLDRPLQNRLSDTYMLIEDYNQQISSANKNRSASYLASIDVGRLTEMIGKCEDGLKGWLKAAGGTTVEQKEEIPSIMDNILGKR